MELRILIYAPAGQDAALASRVLASGAIHSYACRSAQELAQQLALGAGGVLTVDEALQEDACMVLDDYVRQQAGWSDLPITLLTHPGQDSLPLRQAISPLGNLTLLERPIHTLTLITSAHAMLRARRRQYQVREAQRRRNEFLASLGHELRNPLAPIKASAALLGHLQPGSEKLVRLQHVIERQVTHLTRLVDDLLDAARISSGKIELQRQDIVLSAVIGHVAELSQQAALAKHIHITYDLPQQEIGLHADYARTVQLLSNVLVNAVKFTPKAGHIQVSARHEGGVLEVRIRNDGIGLDAQAIPNIFSLFEQGNTVTGQLKSGLGIGLSLSRQFVEMHDGSITAVSAGSGKGSAFIIRLPAAALAPQPAAAETTVAEAAATTRIRALVMDDNCDAADALCALLAMEGH